MLYQTAYSESL